MLSTKRNILIFPFMFYRGITLYPFIILREKKLIFDNSIINHEKIHLRQQVETGVIPFYLIYLMHYLINLFKYRNHDTAYRNICFEKESYINETDGDYLNHRKYFTWMKYW